MTNAEFTQTHDFKKACKQYGYMVHPLKPGQFSPDAEDLAGKVNTTRQASKYRRKTGIVYKTINGTA